MLPVKRIADADIQRVDKFRTGNSSTATGTPLGASQPFGVLRLVQRCDSFEACGDPRHRRRLCDLASGMLVPLPRSRRIALHTHSTSQHVEPDGVSGMPPWSSLDSPAATPISGPCIQASDLALLVPSGSTLSRVPYKPLFPGLWLDNEPDIRAVSQAHGMDYSLFHFTTGAL